MTRRITPIGLGTCLVPISILLLTGPPATAFPAPGTLVLSQSGSVLTIDPATGDRSELSGSAVGSGIAFSSRPLDIVREEGGDFVVSDFDVQALIRVDGSTGDRTVLASSTVGSGGSFRPGPLEIDGDNRLTPANFGTLLVWNSNASAIERVDPVSGDRMVVSSAGVGSGPNLSAVQDMLRFGPCLFWLEDLTLDLMVTDSNLDALVLVSTLWGDRVVLSSASVGSGPAFDTPRGIAMVPPPNFDANGLPIFYVVDSGLNAVVSVTLGYGASYVGDREIVSSGDVGSGPAFELPWNIWPSADGKGLYVTDLGLEAVVHVDLATGNRTIFSDASTGAGPALSGVRSLAAVPTPTLAWGFEDETPGQPPAYAILYSGLIEGSVTVEDEGDFVGSAGAAEGSRLLYLTTGPGARGDPGTLPGQADESWLALPVWRGQNTPRRLRLSVDYLTNEGTEPDPADVVAVSYANALWSAPIAQLSMQTVNPSIPPLGGGPYTALTGFAEGPITGPDGSLFGKGHVGYRTYEIDADFPGVELFLRVADQGDESNDTAMLIDDVRFLPEPGAIGLAAGILLSAVLARRRRRLDAGACKRC